MVLSQWSVTDGKGAKVTLTIESLGGLVERWIPSSPADRDLLIVNSDGTRVATLHQTKAPGAALPAPAARSFKSGSRVVLTWIDELGRRSPPTNMTVGKLAARAR